MNETMRSAAGDYLSKAAGVGFAEESFLIIEDGSSGQPLFPRVRTQMLRPARHRAARAGLAITRASEFRTTPGGFPQTRPTKRCAPQIGASCSGC